MKHKKMPMLVKPLVSNFLVNFCPSMLSQHTAPLDWACRAAWRLGSWLGSYRWWAIHHERQLQHGLLYTSAII